MNGRPNPPQQLAEAFARRIVRWAGELNPTFSDQDLLMRAAYHVSLATAEGHVCVPLDRLAAEGRNRTVGSLAEALRKSGVVGRPDDAKARPLVIDADGRLYLWRYFDYERRLAAALLRIAGARTGSGPLPAAVRTRLNALFAHANGDAADWQKIAAALALLGQLTIISGGPGTGKTTTVVNLLACLIEAQPGCRIALAAPTGKAAARMLAALHERSGELPPDVRQQLPQASFTVHRLLGVLPEGGFRHHADNPLAVDVLVVDEASMLDLALATRLIEALPPGARLILLGDKDQLAAVEAGAVFAEIAADPGLSADTRRSLAELAATPESLIIPPDSRAATPLRDCVVWFSKNYRFREDSGIGRLAGWVNSGAAEAAVDWLIQRADQQVVWRDDHGKTLESVTLDGLLAGYGAYFAALGSESLDPQSVFDAFNRYRVLCAVRESARGVESLNGLLGDAFRRRLAHPLDHSDRSVWFPGRPVLILRNDYTLRLFNGDIGIALPDACGQLRAYFPDVDGLFRAIPLVRLPQHETAFAMTVHKSQGSEFDEIALVLPAKPLPVVTRELIYTGITRARSRVELIGSREVLKAGIAAPTRRHSGLIARLRGGSASPFRADSERLPGNDGNPTALSRATLDR